MPERGGRAITLQDLATHTSGLPRMPDNFQPKDLANPYADYTVERMYQFLSRYQLTRDAGATVDYSNLGAGLLGHVLARRAGMDYDTLVRTRVTGPLGMRHTGHRALARNAGAPRAGAQSGPGAGAELGSADVCRGRRAPIERERHADVPCRRARLRQLAARQRVRHDAVDPASTLVNGGARHRARLADLQGQRHGSHLAQRRHRRLPHVGRVRTPVADGRRRADQCRYGRRSGRHRTPPARPVISLAPEFSAADAAEAAHADDGRCRRVRPLRRPLSVGAIGAAHDHPRRQPLLRSAHRPAHVRDLCRKREGLLPEGRGRAAHVRDRRPEQGRRRGAAPERHRPARAPDRGGAGDPEGDRGRSGRARDLCRWISTQCRPSSSRLPGSRRSSSRN